MSESIEDLFVQDSVKSIMENAIKDIPNIKRLVVIYDRQEGDQEVTICRSVGFVNDYEKLGFMTQNLSDLMSGNVEEIGDN